MKKLLVNLSLSCALGVSYLGFAGAEALAYDAAADNAVYFATTGSVDISSKPCSAPNQAVTLVITKDSPEEFTYDGEDTLVDFVRTDDEGRIKYTANLPSGFSSGRYRVYIFGRDDAVVEMPYFAHISLQSVSDIIVKVNLADSKAAMSEIVEANAEALVIDGDYDKEQINLIAEALYDLKKSGGNYKTSEPEKFLADFNLAKAIAEIRSGRDVAEVLKNYSSYFGIDYLTDYNSLSSDARKCLDGLLKDADYSSGSASVMYQEFKIYSIVKTATSYQKIQAAIEEEKHFELISPDTKYYDKLKDKSAVYRRIAEDVDDIRSFDDIDDVFYKASKSVYDDVNSVKKDSGGGGGGGSTSGKGSYATVLPLDTVADTQSKPVLTDIQSHWARNEILSLCDAGIISGYGDSTFRPDATVTRAEFVKLIVSAFDISSETKVSFGDVENSDWFCPYVETAAGAGIVSGVGDSLFAPGSSITRQDASLMIYRIVSSKLDSAQTSEFADSDLIGGYAVDAVTALASNGIITGFEDSTFRPLDHITRAQAAVIISRAMKGGEA